MALMTVQGDGAVLVPLEYTRLLNCIGQLAYLGLINIDNTRTTVNNLYFLTALNAASKMLRAMAVIKWAVSALSQGFFLSSLKIYSLKDGEMALPL